MAYNAVLNGGNGTSLAILRHPGTGQATKLTWTGPAGTLATDEVFRSRSGMVVDERIDNIDAFGAWATEAGANFVHDAAGAWTWPGWRAAAWTTSAAPPTPAGWHRHPPAATPTGPRCH